METIIIRELEAPVMEKLIQAARQEDKEVSLFASEIIRKYLDTANQEGFPKTYHDMDHLFGTWSEEEFRRIQGKIDSEQKADADLWK